MIIIKVLVLIILAFLFLLLALLLGFVLFPFHFKGTFTYDKSYQLLLNVRWLWGIIGLGFTILPGKKLFSLKLSGLNIITYSPKSVSPEKKKEKVAKKTQKKAKKKEKKQKKREKKRITLDKQLEKAVETAQTLSFEALTAPIAFFSRLFGSLKLKVTGQAELGLSDPADTGMLLGFAHSTLGALNVRSFNFYPSWEERVVKGKATFYVRVWIGEILLIAIRMVLSRAIRRIWWPLVRKKFSIRKVKFKVI